jgi:hypothetical protein
MFGFQEFGASLYEFSTIRPFLGPNSPLTGLPAVFARHWSMRSDDLSPMVLTLHHVKTASCISICWFFAGVMTAPQIALADDWSLHAVVAGQVAATDNIFQVPSNSPEGTPRTGDLLFQLRPGALLAIATPRSTHQVAADLDVIGYAKQRDAWSVSGRATWRGLFLLSQRTELVTGIAAASGTLNSLVARSNDPSAALVPTGSSDFVSAEGRQQLTHQASTDVRVTQHSQAQIVQTIGSNQNKNLSTDLGAGGGFDRSWRFDSFGVDVSGTFVRFSRSEDPSTNNSLFNIRTAAQWRHDISRRWSSNVDGGVVAVVPISSSSTASSSTVLVPIIGAQLAYAPQWGTAGISVSRSVVPNLFVAQNTVADAVVGNVNMPLPWLSEHRARPQWSALGSVGFTRTQLVDSNRGELASSFSVINLDLALQHEISEQSSVSARYQFIRQSGNADSLTIIQGYARNTFLVSFTYRYPRLTAARFPSRDSVRVDRSDVSPVGDEAGSRGARPSAP